MKQKDKERIRYFYYASMQKVLKEHEEYQVDCEKSFPKIIGQLESMYNYFECFKSYFPTKDKELEETFWKDFIIDECFGCEFQTI